MSPSKNKLDFRFATEVAQDPYSKSVENLERKYQYVEILRE